MYLLKVLWWWTSPTHSDFGITIIFGNFSMPILTVNSFYWPCSQFVWCISNHFQLKERLSKLTYPMCSNIAAHNECQCHDWWWAIRQKIIIQYWLSNQIHSFSVISIHVHLLNWFHTTSCEYAHAHSMSTLTIKLLEILLSGISGILRWQTVSVVYHILGKFQKFKRGIIPRKKDWIKISC